MKVYSRRTQPKRENCGRRKSISFAKTKLQRRKWQRSTRANKNEESNIIDAHVATYTYIYICRGKTRSILRIPDTHIDKIYEIKCNVNGRLMERNRDGLALHDQEFQDIYLIAIQLQIRLYKKRL
ncbi:uncharacterized protein LOC143433449 [Xylocopa sonorina]|uniref:uncharacterized protein LOC143433449 n=1 Tax=Xylocopa sonorina TaxID=1818115 RepID=UPI00403B2FD4